MHRVFDDIIMNLSELQLRQHHTLRLPLQDLANVLQFLEWVPNSPFRVPIELEVFGAEAETFVYIYPEAMHASGFDMSLT